MLETDIVDMSFSRELDMRESSGLGSNLFEWHDIGVGRARFAGVRAREGVVSNLFAIELHGPILYGDFNHGDRFSVDGQIRYDLNIIRFGYRDDDADTYPNEKLRALFSNEEAEEYRRAITSFFMIPRPQLSEQPWGYLKNFQDPNACKFSGDVRFLSGWSARATKQ